MIRCPFLTPLCSGPSPTCMFTVCSLRAGLTNAWFIQWPPTRFLLKGTLSLREHFLVGGRLELGMLTIRLVLMGLLRVSR